MDRTGGLTASELCATVWRSTLGFYCKSFRFEGGGRQYNRGRLFRRFTNFRWSNSFNYMKYFVVGLNRTGKSCRLRWVNYLHPGLKRGKMTPQEERLVLELHAKWGNRWSRIARKLPGRTDNEIKNYWRTHMRKKAQERKRAVSSPSSSSSNCSSSSSTVTTVDSLPCPPQGKASFYDTGGNDETPVAAALVEDYETGCYSMDDIWKDIELSEGKIMKQGGNGNGNFNFACPSPMASPACWDYPFWDSMWKMDEGDEERKMMINPPNDDQFISSWAATLTG